MESLSHLEFTEGLELLAARGWRQLRARSRKGLQNSTARRRFAQVGDAIVQVLADAGTDLRMIEVHEAVEELLGEPVSRSSVKNYLASNSQRPRRRIERVSRGHYRLLSAASPSKISATSH
jgi:hypothetical protein